MLFRNVLDDNWGLRLNRRLGRLDSLFCVLLELLRQIDINSAYTILLLTRNASDVTKNVVSLL